MDAVLGSRRKEKENAPFRPDFHTDPGHFLCEFAQSVDLQMTGSQASN